MKLTSFSTMIILHMATSSTLWFITPTQSTFLPRPGLVEHVCRKTPHYHLCVFTLKSHLRSLERKSAADIAGLARIALEVVAANASATLTNVHKFRAQTNGPPRLKAVLEGCISSYTKMVKELLPEAMSCMEKGDYGGVQRSAYAAGALAGACESKCKEASTSVMSDTNLYVQNLCTIAVSLLSKVPPPQSTHQPILA